MPHKYPTYAPCMPHACPTYVPCMPQICPKYAPNMAQICPKYAPCMPHVCSMYAGLLKSSVFYNIFVCLAMITICPINVQEATWELWYWTEHQSRGHISPSGWGRWWQYKPLMLYRQELLTWLDAFVFKCCCMRDMIALTRAILSLL